MGKIVIVVAPHLEPAMMGDGKVHRDKFEARLGDRLLCVSWTPFVDSARALLAEGVDPNTTITMRHLGKDHDALRGTLGVVGGLRVSGPNFRPAAASQKADLLALDEKSDAHPVEEAAE
jgi:hypothetical protein